MSKRSSRGARPAPQPAPPPEEVEAAELQLSSDEEYESGNELASLSGSDGDGGGEDGSGVEREIENAVLGYMAAAQKHRQRGGRDSEGEESGEEDGNEGPDVTQGSGGSEEEASDGEAAARGAGAAEAPAGAGPGAAGDPASDSSEDERPNRNTVGSVPLEWYRDEEHVGYDVDGGRLLRRPRRDRLAKLVARNDSSTAELRTVYDEYNDEEIVLSKEELRMIQRIREGRFPHVEVDPFEPEVDWFTRDVEVMPLSGAPEPKRRFVPSKWEEKKVVKLVRALRKGWIKRDSDVPKKPDTYLIWEDDGRTLDKTAPGLTYIPAPKLKLPGHEESYNPPKEYLPSEAGARCVLAARPACSRRRSPGAAPFPAHLGTPRLPPQEERNAQQLLDEEERPFVPTAYDCLRRVPAYANFVKERFERCLDLYLCPRTRRKRVYIEDPEVLVPKLPKPQDLQPFPTLLAIRFTGHTQPVRSVCPDATGQWLLSGSDDGSVRLWEVRTGRCMRVWQLGEPVSCVAWCPSPQLQLLAAAAGKRLFLLPTGTGSEEQAAATESTLEACAPAGSEGGAVEEGQLAGWQRREGGGAVVLHKWAVKHVTWHARGDYFATTAPAGNTQAVLVHQLGRGATQNPFRKNRGRVVRVLFHPTKPFFFVATQQNVRVYNLAKQALAKKLVVGAGVVTCMAVHPSGDHLIVGSEDKRLCWFDLDLSSTPYRALRYHGHAVRGAAFHRSYPLFASASDDATAHVFHGRVYADLMTNPLIVPVKILRGHEAVDYRGVLDVAFHPTQPWVFTAGGDATACLFVNP